MKKYLALAVLLLALAGAIKAQTQVTIQNPSFETFNRLNQSNSTGSWNTGPIPGWMINGQPGGYGAGSGQSSTTIFPAGGEDGETYAFALGAAISQDLAVGAVASTNYTLSFYVGNRLDRFNNGASWTVTLNIGSTVLCSKSGPNNAISEGTWVLQTVGCQTSSSVPNGDLVLMLSGANGEALFDNFSLSYGGHQTSLTWEDNLNPSGTTYNIYRSDGATWNPVLLANVSTFNYTDTTIVANQSYVYKVTTVLIGVESIDGQFIGVTLGVQ
jgi:hypothetical protein